MIMKLIINIEANNKFFTIGLYSSKIVYLCLATDSI